MQILIGCAKPQTENNQHFETLKKTFEKIVIPTP